MRIVDEVGILVVRRVYVEQIARLGPVLDESPWSTTVSEIEHWESLTRRLVNRMQEELNPDMDFRTLVSGSRCTDTQDKNAPRSNDISSHYMSTFRKLSTSKDRYMGYITRLRKTAFNAGLWHQGRADM